MRSFLFAVLAISIGTVAGCSTHDDDDGHDHTDGGHTTKYPSCTEITLACHPFDVEAGPIHDCHDFGHSGTEETCAAKKAECLAICVAPADAGPDAAGDAANEHD